MASLLQVIAFLLTLVSCSIFAAEIQLSDRKLDCSTVESALLSQFPEICSKIHEWSNTYIDLLLEERIRTVEQCTCHLVRHNIAWQYMMTHEVESLFNAIKVVLDGMDNEEANLAVPSESIMFQGEEGESLQFWDKLNALNNNADDYKEKLFTPLTEAFAKLYYRTSDMSMPYVNAKGEPKKKDLRDTFTEICNSVYIPFARFGQYFANLRQMAQNTRFVYRVATFDEDLYKIISVVKVCQAMAMGDDIELYI